MLLLLALLASTPSLQHARVAGAPRIHPQRLLVRLDPALGQVPLSRLRPELGVRELWNLPQIGWRAIEVAPGRRDAIKARLQGDPGVLEVCFDPRRELSYTPNDTLYPSQWHMGHIDADNAWDTEKGDPSVVVAIVDTG